MTGLTHIRNWLRKRPSIRGALGMRGERAARRYLKRQGHRILAANVRTRAGEVDLLTEAPDRRTVVIVEVKAGQGDHLPPEVHLNSDKQRRLAALAGQVLRRYRLTGRPVRFDAVIVHWPAARRRPDVRHYAGAFEAGI